jgi:hypothetical protein
MNLCYAGIVAKEQYQNYLAHGKMALKLGGKTAFL